jgi:putative endonuclease
MSTRSDVGMWGESIAQRHLQQRGYDILHHNWRYDHGEIDLIAKQRDTFVFVEVRTRHGDAFGAPEETINARKQAKLIATAQAYLELHELRDADWRIDVIAIDLDAKHAVKRLNHIECAISN